MHWGIQCRPFARADVETVNAGGRKMARIVMTDAGRRVLAHGRTAGWLCFEAPDHRVAICADQPADPGLTTRRKASATYAWSTLID